MHQLSETDVLRDVERSGCLGASKQLFRLLSFLLDNSHNDNAAHVKQFTIAVDLFGRPESFDPSTDSIVRVEMHRLRAALKLFNEKNRGYKIMLPKGSFKITLMISESAEISKPFLKQLSLFKKAQRAHLNYLFLALIATILFFSNSFRSYELSDNVDYCSTGVPNVSIRKKGDASELIDFTASAISAVAGQHSSVNIVENIDTCKGAAPSFVIQVSSLMVSSNRWVTVSTYHGEPANIVHLVNIDVPQNLELIESSFSHDVIRNTVNIVKPYGVIPRYVARLTWEDEGRAIAYRCIIEMYDSFSISSDEAYMQNLECLESAHHSGMATPDNIGSLAVAYLTQHAGYQEHTLLDPFGKAESLIEAAGDDWMINSEMMIAKLIIESERPEFYPDRLRFVLSAAETNFNNNPHVVLTAAIRSGYKLGDWEYAKKLSDRVKIIHSERDSSVYAVDAAYALLFADPKDVMLSCTPTYSQRSVLNNVLVNACARKANDSFWQTKTENNLKGFKTFEELENFVLNRNYEPNLTAVLVSKVQ